MDESGRLAGMSWPCFRGVQHQCLHCVGNPSLPATWLNVNRKARIPSCVCWLLRPVTTSHMAMFKSVALLSSFHPFSGKPILCVWNKVTDPILKGILFEGKYSKLNEQIYPNYQIFTYYSIGPQSQHYPWEEVKSTYQEPLLNMLII